MSALLDPVVYMYRSVLNPLHPFSSWLGTPITMLDLGAAFRLCMVMRQVRELLRAKHVEAAAKTDKATVAKIETRSFMREAVATLIVVYGGEAITGESSFISLVY